MFCPECGGEIPDTAKFCMECGTDLREFQQSSEGGVNTGDVGMIKDSELKSTKSQQQTSIEQNPTINIQLGEIIRDIEQLVALKYDTDERAAEIDEDTDVSDAHQTYDDIEKSEISVSEEVSELLKQAKYATSDREARAYYERILETDLECEIAWFQKFVLESKNFREAIINKIPLPVPNTTPKQEPVVSFIENAVDQLKESHDSHSFGMFSMARINQAWYPGVKNTSEHMNKVKDARKKYFCAVIESDFSAMHANPELRHRSNMTLVLPTWKWAELRALRNAAKFFDNAHITDPSIYKMCSKCEGTGYIKRISILDVLQIQSRDKYEKNGNRLIWKSSTERGTTLDIYDDKMGLDTMYMCPNCLSMGKIRIQRRE